MDERNWAYHMGHFLNDQKYGARSSEVFEQGFLYSNGQIQDRNRNTLAVTSLNAHVNLLEDFSPLRTNDPNRWIPQGLYYDLFDNRNDRNAVPLRINLDDIVSGYTNQQFFNALDSDIKNLTDYRARLLSENGNNQATGVTSIFNFYGY